MQLFQASYLGENISFTQGLYILGLTTLFVSFAAIGGFFGRLAQFFRGHSEPQVNKSQSDAQRTQKSGTVDPHLLAILTAAATVAIGRRVVVRRVTFINQDTVSGWAEAGRNLIHLSHNLHRDMH